MAGDGWIELDSVRANTADWNSDTRTLERGSSLFYTALLLFNACYYNKIVPIKRISLPNVAILLWKENFTKRQSPNINNVPLYLLYNFLRGQEVKMGMNLWMRAWLYVFTKVLTSLFIFMILHYENKFIIISKQANTRKDWNLHINFPMGWHYFPCCRWIEGHRSTVFWQWYARVFCFPKKTKPKQ